MTISSIRETARFARAVASLNPQRMQEYLAACFAAGTPILGEHGPRPIEDFKPGDKVWSRDENDPDGPLELKEIEECFDRTGRIFHLHVGGQVIRTTDEHPFWVDGKGWVKTIELERGEKLGLSDEEVAFYDALAHHESAREVLGDQNLFIIAREVAKSIRNNVSIDWTIKESVRAKLRSAVKRVLRKYGYPPDQQEKATDLVLQQAELLCAELAG